MWKRRNVVTAAPFEKKEKAAVKLAVFQNPETSKE